MDLATIEDHDIGALDRSHAKACPSVGLVEFVAHGFARKSDTFEPHEHRSNSIRVVIAEFLDARSGCKTHLTHPGQPKLRKPGLLFVLLIAINPILCSPHPA